MQSINLGGHCVITRNVKHLRAAAAMLTHLRSDPDDLARLLALQRFLLARICAAERHIARLRSLVARQRAARRALRLEKAQSTSLKGRIMKCDSMVRGARHWIFIWKCFGDGMVCVYQSPYNLKPLFYDHNYEVKEDAGTVSGKDGLMKEWYYLEWAIRESIPAILADLTNMIRTGDICLLGASDPLPIEIKTGSASGARAARQHHNLQEVLAFYANDGATNFRGIPSVTREVVTEGPNYAAIMNDCIAAARSDGLGSATAEPGLHYVAWHSQSDVVGLLDAFTTRGTLVWLLTPDLGWLPCYPFSLSLTGENLESFVTGEIAMCVLIDTSHLRTLFRQHGTYAIMLLDGTFAMQLCVDPANLMYGTVRITELLFARIALEFQSLAWFARQFAFKPKSEDPHGSTQIKCDSAAWVTQVPESWMRAVDYFDGTPAHRPGEEANQQLR